MNPSKKTLLILSLFLILGLVSEVSIAQPDSLWSQVYDNNNIESCYSALVTPDNGYVLAGDLGDNGRWDFYIVKTDSAGERVWHRQYGGERNEFCRCIVRTLDDCLITAGFSNSFGDGILYGWVLKVNMNGDSLWANNYGINSSELGNAFATADTGFIVCGITYGFENGSGWLVKMDKDGEVEWENCFGGYAYLKAVVQTFDGGYAAAGWSTAYGEGGPDMYLIKLDSEGNEEWSQAYGTQETDWCFDMIEPVIKLLENSMKLSPINWALSGILCN